MNRFDGEHILEEDMS